MLPGHRYARSSPNPEGATTELCFIRWIGGCQKWSISLQKGDRKELSKKQRSEEDHWEFTTVGS